MQDQFSFSNGILVTSESYGEAKGEQSDWKEGGLWNSDFSPAADSKDGAKQVSGPPKEGCTHLRTSWLCYVEAEVPRPLNTGLAQPRRASFILLSPPSGTHSCLSEWVPANHRPHL